MPTRATKAGSEASSSRSAALPSATILERMKPAISSDNPFAYKWIGPPFLNLRGVIEAVGGRNYAGTAFR